MALRTPEELFFEKVGPQNSSGCMPWVGCIDKDGCGVFYVGREKHKAHRARYILQFESIPAFHNILHTCDNKLCVNIEHLICVHQRASKKKSGA